MSGPDVLHEGYRRFREQTYPERADLYRDLAEKGQRPATMIIGCCDSRADPAIIFDAAPGSLFMVRNVANLVPPFAPGGHHGTSAAIEFAVNGLEVPNIVVMGHQGCGGIKAFLEGGLEPSESNMFITPWMAMMAEARAEVLRELADQSPAVRQTAMEKRTVPRSLDNLMSFPFVAERVADGRLALHGAYFHIATGEVLWLDRETGTFAPAQT